MNNLILFEVKGDLILELWSFLLAEKLPALGVWFTREWIIMHNLSANKNYRNPIIESPIDFK